TRMPGRVRRITVYETPQRFYLVGSDNSGTRFNLLKIDRLDSKALLTGEPENDYSKSDIMQILSTVNEGSSIVCKSSGSGSKKGRPNGGLLERVYNAFGVLGVVRFTEGYYLIVITKATVMATFGYHTIYKIAEVAMMSLASDDHVPSAEEQRYLKQFQSVDLSTDFYFSYTYDLSRSLQENAVNTNWDNNGDRTIRADNKFVWNKFLLEPLRSNLVSERWFVECVHGFVRQQIIELPCSKFSLVLIGRRSSDYAGTRFLKRGANLKGDVANDVETEQIVWDMNSAASIDKGRFSAFVQRRGSVPLRWSQDPSTRGVVGKPLILIGIHEPHAQTAAAHFRDLKQKYGDPIVVMNLVKKREKRRGDENLLHEQFIKSVRYLNQFLPLRNQICYISFDVARCNKSSSTISNVITKLEELGDKIVCKSGWFQSFPLPHCRTKWPHRSFSSFSPSFSSCGRFLIQNGVCRTNCVDCLDRTNVAQFGIGKVALAFQLCAFGVLDEPLIELSSEISRVYEDLFDEHGDTMAWQYAGSQLVHSVKHYKKMGAFQERSRDIIQNLSRYYSNTFSDYDKQAALNLFLGVYRPQITSNLHLWDLPSDFYLHFKPTEKVTKDYCLWWTTEEEDRELMDGDYVIVNSQRNRPSVSSDYRVVRIATDDDFREYYRTFEMTSLDLRLKQLALVDCKTVNVAGVNEEPPSGQLMKLFKSDPKPMSKKKKAEMSDDEDDDGEETRDDTIVQMDEVYEKVIEPKAEESIFPQSTVYQYVPLSLGMQSPLETYGMSDRSAPSQSALRLYENYAAASSINVNPEDWSKLKPKDLLEKFKETSRIVDKYPLFTADNICHTEIPAVTNRWRRFYEESCSLDKPLSAADQKTFNAYDPKSQILRSP
ncbi:hypothetical protein PFISCL1PPCAC_19559, partial [Pristionchus fissidentatus]